MVLNCGTIRVQGVIGLHIEFVLWRWRGPSGLRWVSRNGRGPHLEGRQEPQASSPFRTPTAGSLQSWDRRVRPSLVWRKGWRGK